MVISNETTVTKDRIKGAMYASNYKSNRYKFMKAVLNGGGLLFGMVFVTALIPEMAYGKGNMVLIIISGVLCMALLLAGMYGMDLSNIKRFRNIYADYAGKTYVIDIDSDEIIIREKSKENVENPENICIKWGNIIDWQEDINNFYLIMEEGASVIVGKDEFVECGARDLKELATAVMYMRKEVEDDKNTQ